MDTDHRVVIVGGGFGGLKAAQALKSAPVQVTLIDRRNFHLFQPLLYQVATGALSPGHIASPLRWVLRHQKNAKVLLGHVRDIDAKGKRVWMDDADGGQWIPYDTLIIATGARHSYFGHQEWEEHAPGLKTVEDATEIRAKILYAFEAAEKEQDPVERRKWLRFVIVGGGPTGVELAGTLGEIANDTLKRDFRSIRPEDSEVVILDAGDRILSSFTPEHSAKAEQLLIKLGVRTRNGVMVTSVDAEGVQCKAGGREERIEAKTVLWAAGVAASSLGKIVARETGAQLDRSGRVPVKADCSVDGHEDIFVLGDLASQAGADGKPLPGVAAVAQQQGDYVGKLIRKRIAGETYGPFRYVNKGNLATIGRASAIADFGKVKLSGYPAWLAWLFIHLMLLVGFQNRILVMMQWAFEYFTYNRGARLITGESVELAARRQAPSKTLENTPV